MKAAIYPGRAGLDRWATYREAMEQPAIWRGWARPLEAHAVEIAAWLKERRHEEIWFCGAGTSAFIGDTLCSHLNRPGTGPRYRSVPTTDLVSCPGSYLPTDKRVLVVSFGRSGDSSETIGTLDLLDAHLPRADRLNFTCNGDGALANRLPEGAGERKVVLLPPATNDRGFAMTSSYSTMLLSALACFDETVPLPLGETMSAIAYAGERVLANASVLAEGSPRPARVVFLGSGALTATARESALKVLELAQGQIPTLWDSTLGFRHGPKAFVDDSTRVFVFVSNDSYTRRYDLDAAEEIRTQFGKQAVVVQGSSDIAPDLVIPPTANDAWTGVLHVLAAQIHAVTWSNALGVNVDNPFATGNLSRVVSGVSLYPFVTSR